MVTGPKFRLRNWIPQSPFSSSSVVFFIIFIFSSFCSAKKLMGNDSKTVAGVGLLQLLLLLYLHIVLLHRIKATMAASQGDYVASFTPQDTPHFWCSKPGGNFTFGFKLLDGGEYLLAIWHSLDVKQTAIWWADFEDVNNPTNTVKKGATLNYTSSGGLLQLYDSTSSLVWQSGSYSSTSTSLQFLDTGNLKLVKDNNTSDVWASFKDRRDSLMLTGLEASLFINRPLLLQSRKNQTSYERGRFHMATYNRFDIHLFGLDKLKKQYVYMKDYNVSLIISGDVVRVGNQLDGSAFVSDNSSLQRLSLDYDANLRVYQWAYSNLTWVIIWELMDDWTLICRAQSPCGPFGLCIRDSANTISCSCPSGYAPISPNDPTRGCNSSRIPPLCTQGNTRNNFIIEEVQLGDYYYNDLFWLTKIHDIAVCKNVCLSNCACIAATYDSGRFMCFLKGNSTMGYLENGYVSAGGANTLLMKLLPLMPPRDKKDRHLVPIIVVVAAFAACVMLWLWRKRTNGPSRYGRKQDNEGWDARQRRFFYQELVEATKNFSDLLGEGAYGAVFRGQVRDRKGKNGPTSGPAISAVAVKVLKQRESYTRGVENTAMKQFRAEVGTLRNIHHINLVSLLGYCIGGPGRKNRRLLVYEYMENGALNRYLSPTHMREPLPWPLRYSIAVGTARGIAYLHHDCNPRILHCDIKPQNVLLDEHFTPKVADFGMASYIEKGGQTHLTVSCMKGTRGYMAPEWVTSDAITPKADVYSFGVLLLELVHGLNSVENMLLRGWALQCLAAKSLIPDNEIIRRAGHAADQGPYDENAAVNEAGGLTSGTAALQSTYISTTAHGESDLEQQLRCLRVALWCVQQMPTKRPPMSLVLQQLEGNLDTQDPPDPAATSKRNCLRVGFDRDSTSASSNRFEFSFSVVSAR